MTKLKRTPRLEFKSGDNAWYDVSVQLIKASYLKVHYQDFPEDEDEKLQLKDFKTAEDVKSRFRSLSKQLQDQHCDRVKEGMVICTSCSSNKGKDMGFFDATVEKVYQSKHDLVDGEEQCRCAFKVRWQDGPSANQSTIVFCKDICLLTEGSIETHPIINAFLKLVEEKMDSRTQSIGQNTSRRKITNTKGRGATLFKDKQAEARDRANGKVSDHHSGSRSSECKIKEKKDEKVVSITDNVLTSRANITENVLTSPEPLLEDPAASENELKSSVESESDVGSEIKNFRYSHKGTVLNKDGSFSEITRLQGDGDMRKKDFRPPEAPSLSSGNTNFEHEIIPKNGKEAIVDAKLLSECKETNLNIVRKEQNTDLSNLNSAPCKLQIVHPCIGSVSCAMDVINTVGNNVNTPDKGFGELNDTVGIVENVRACCSGNLQAENCDNLIKERSGHNIVCSGIDESSGVNVDSGSYNSEGLSKQLIMVENQKDQQSSEDKGVKRKFPASWGRVKQQKHRSNTMLLRERVVQDNSEKGKHKNALENCLHPNIDSNGVATLRSSLTASSLKPLNSKEPLDCFRDSSGIQQKTMQNVEEIGMDVHEDKLTLKQLRSNEVRTPKVSLGAGDTKKGDSVNAAIDALKTSCLTTPSMKRNKRKDPCDSFKDSSDLQEQTVKEHIDNHASKHKHFECELEPSKVLPEVVAISSNEVRTPKVSLGAGDTEKGDSVNASIDALKTSCLTTPSMKLNKRKDPCDGFKDPSDLQEQTVKEHIDNHASKHKHFDGELEPSKVLPEVVAISSNRDVETDHAFPRKDIDSERKDISRQHNNNAHLQEFLPMSVDPVSRTGLVPRESEQPSHGHFNKDLKVEVQERRFSSSEVLILDNLEKDVSCSDVIKVMSDLTSGVDQVYIVPCLNFEKFTSGFVLFRDRPSLMKAYARLQDDNFFVVSSNGRPWVVLDIEDRLSEGVFGRFTVNSKEPESSCSPSASGKILFVHKGMKEYEKIKARKETFLEFRKHFASLYEIREDEDKYFMNSPI